VFAETHGFVVAGVPEPDKFIVDPAQMAEVAGVIVGLSTVIA
jgi:hypothetical protein